jgi:hypothetical protein
MLLPKPPSALPPSPQCLAAPSCSSPTATVPLPSPVPPSAPSPPHHRHPASVSTINSIYAAANCLLPAPLSLAHASAHTMPPAAAAPPARSPRSLESRAMDSAMLTCTVPHDAVTDAATVAASTSVTHVSTSDSIMISPILFHSSVSSGPPHSTAATPLAHASDPCLHVSSCPHASFTPTLRSSSLSMPALGAGSPSRSPSATDTPSTLASPSPAEPQSARALDSLSDTSVDARKPLDDACLRVHSPLTSDLYAALSPALSTPVSPSASLHMPLMPAPSVPPAACSTLNPPVPSLLHSHTANPQPDSSSAADSAHLDSHGAILSDISTHSTLPQPSVALTRPRLPLSALSHLFALSSPATRCLLLGHGLLHRILTTVPSSSTRSLPSVLLKILFCSSARLRHWIRRMGGKHQHNLRNLCSIRPPSHACPA